MIFTRETNPAAGYRTDSPAHEWEYRALRDQLDRRAAALGQPMPIPQFPTRPGADVDVYVNHSRWLWECPTCRASFMAADTGIGFCTNCWNAGGGWYTLVWPDTRAEIELALGARPDPATRNWFPAETVDVLLAENEQHGLAA